MRRISWLAVALFTVVAATPVRAEHVIAFEFGTRAGSSGVQQSLATTGTSFALGVQGVDGTGEGGGYVSVRAADTGGEITRIDAPDPTMNLFGDTIAFSHRGLVIGGPHALESVRGAVFLFGRRDVDPSRTFAAPAGAGRNFGSAVAWTGDSVLVGDQRWEIVDATSGSGHAYLVHPRTGALRKTLEAPAPHGGVGFGAAVAAFDRGFAISEVGTRLLPGAVHLYDRRGRYLQTLQAPVPTPGDAFGAVLAASGGQLLIGAPTNVHRILLSLRWGLVVLRAKRVTGYYTGAA